MGSFLHAKCECGFNSEFAAGGGFINFKTNCSAPAICQHCMKFHVLNYLTSDQECPECGNMITFYNDPSVQVTLDDSVKQTRYDFEKNVFSWFLDPGEFVLPNTNYLCPDCGKMTMRFLSAGMWD